MAIYLVLSLLAGAILGFAQSDRSRVCAGCHKEIWDTYRQTAMGRSFARPSAQNTPVPMDAFYHAPSESYFTMFLRGGEYFLRRHQLDSGGREINVMEKRVDYVMGSGNHAHAYLHRTVANTLIELPLGWYAEKGGYWAMNPGFDRPDHDGFRRPINYDCMFCHNAYPKIPAGNELPGAEPVYAGELPGGIDCERCHGSGARHMELAGRSGVARDLVRQAIVNPARLSSERQLEICMACHLETTSFPLPNAIQKYGRGPFSFRPGEPLADFILNFDHAPGAGREDKFEFVSAAYRMRKSACFVKSEQGPARASKQPNDSVTPVSVVRGSLNGSGKMLCTTCHNPHAAPRGQAATQHYNGVCRQCHAGPLSVASHVGQDNCVECHMPKRRTEDVVHAVVTDHYIQRRPPAGDLLAARAERHETGDAAYRGPVVWYYPERPPQTAENDLYLAAAQVKQSSNLAQGITQLTKALERYPRARTEFYLDLAEALQKSGQLPKALPYFQEAARRDPKKASVQQKLGTALRRSGRHREAVEILNRAASMGPTAAVTWHELGLAHWAMGKGADAVAAIGKALDRDAELPEAHNNLGIIFLAEGGRPRAEAAFREAIRIRPDYADARGNLANLLAAAGNTAEAREHFEAAVRWRPADAATRYNYATLLGRMGHYDEAQRELEASLRADPKFVDAHELLANLLMAKGQARDAIPHYREVLLGRPGSPSAHLSLGAALAAAGEISEAIPHLRQAAAGPDPEVRDQATQILRQIEQERR
jgi:predicted CXXCH cytochrome family protein